MTKECAKCGQTKELDEFVRDKQRKDGHYPYCKACHRSIAKRMRVEQADHIKQRRAEYTARRDANREAREKYLLGNWVYSLKRRYGITVHEFLAMVEAQGNRCAICHETPDPQAPRQGRTLHVDHDHATGKVRALLCFRCNAGLGSFREKPDLMQSAISYLAAHGRKAATHDRARAKQQRAAGQAAGAGADAHNVHTQSHDAAG